ncbi:MAG: prefoldin subunit beta [archaeon]|nr:prefoldin subunit beta [archaeon]
MNGMSPQLQNQITQYQQVQQQLQNTTAQKMQMQTQLREMQRTVEELGKATGDVYKNVGSLLIKVDDKASLTADLEESIETMEIRVKGLERQETSLREKYEVLQDTINRAMGNAPAPRPAPQSDDEEED